MESPIPDELLKLVDFFSPNETELARLTGLPTETFEQIVHAVEKIHDKVRLTLATAALLAFIFSFSIGNSF